MVLQEIFEKVKTENAASLLKHGKWKDRIPETRQGQAMLNEFSEWYAAYSIGDTHGEHGEIEELVDLINVACRRIMFLTGEDQ